MPDKSIGKILREDLERYEQEKLSVYATLSINSKGRERTEIPCQYRTVFQRDRDRILHSNSFRRLIHKTQVFLSPEGDHFRTRLTHTLEVSQVARTISRSLSLNEDLAEAISYGHDLGHTPFGHAGETALDKALKKFSGDKSMGFKHYEQGVRVVEKLEKDGNGLNLTYEVRNGIGNHSAGLNPETPEAKIVHIADRVAYLNHDFDDAVRANVISKDSIPKPISDVLGKESKIRIDRLISSVVENSGSDIQMDDEIGEAFLQFRKFMFAEVYNHKDARKEERKVDNLILNMFDYYINNVEVLPPLYREIAEKEGAYRAVADYIAGMTDNFALHEYDKIFIPKSWGGS